MSRLLTVRNGLIIAAAALAAGLGWVTDWGRGLGKPEISLASLDGKANAPGVLPDFSLSSGADAYPQIAARPLLNPTRKPAPTEIAQAPVEPVKPRIRRGLYQLVGVTDMGDNKYAMLKESSTNKTRSVKVGDSLQEMKVKEISATGVVLEFKGETDQLQLAKYTASGRVPQLPAPAAAPPPSPPPPPVAANSGEPAPTTENGEAEKGRAPVAGQPPNAGNGVDASTAANPGAPRTERPREAISTGELLQRRRLAREQQQRQ